MCRAFKSRIGAQDPVLRTACSRAAFQIDGSDAAEAPVRVSIDTGLTFSREFGVERAPGAWCVAFWSSIAVGAGASVLSSPSFRV